jgi:hypothetical protein
MAFPGGRDTGRCCRDNRFRCLSDNAPARSGNAEQRVAHRHPARPRRVRLDRVAAVRVAPQTALVSRVALSALFDAGRRSHAPLGAGEDGDLHPLTQRANPERGNRLETDGAARRARHVQVPPSRILVGIGRADVRRLRRLERIDQKAGELLGRRAIEQHGDWSDGHHETTSRRHDSQVSVHDSESVFLVASSGCQFGPTFRHRYLSFTLPHCHRIDASNRAVKS